MIYLEPVCYADDDLTFFQAFELGDPRPADYWSADECSNIKTTIKRHYLDKQRNTCCYCRQIIIVDHGRVWDTEHIVPRKTHPGFMFTPQNLALACPDCNGRKASKQTLVAPDTSAYPSTGDAFLVVHPHFDNYDEHIEMGDFVYTGISDRGEWTVINCDLNRLAGRAFGWPDPIADERFEDLVDDVFDGDGAAPGIIQATIESELNS